MYSLAYTVYIPGSYSLRCAANTVKNGGKNLVSQLSTGIENVSYLCIIHSQNKLPYRKRIFATKELCSLTEDLEDLEHSVQLLCA